MYDFYDTMHDCIIDHAKMHESYAICNQPEYIKNGIQLNNKWFMKNVYHRYFTFLKELRPFFKQIATK